MKKRVFIGSSVESKELAYKIQQRLSDNFDCVLWYEGFFSIGNHFYSDLIQKIITFDYAIMIGGVDDFVTRISTQAQKNSPRDNIYLEYGLFSGILSPKRVLLLIDSKCVPASDLSGMSLAQYQNGEHAVDLAADWIDNDKKETILTGKNVELLPTVGIAVGYYYNFLKPFFNSLFSSESLPCDFKLHIFFPDYICNDVDYYKQELISEKHLTEKIITKYRILVNEDDPKVLHMYDIPNTILTLFKTVDYIFRVQDGNTDDTLYAKQKALNNFYDNLKILISNDYKIKKHIVLEHLGNNL